MFSSPIASISAAVRMGPELRSDELKAPNAGPFPNGDAWLGCTPSCGVNGGCLRRCAYVPSPSRAIGSAAAVGSAPISADTHSVSSRMRRSHTSPCAARGRGVPHAAVPMRSICKREHSRLRPGSRVGMGGLPLLSCVKGLPHAYLSAGRVSPGLKARKRAGLGRHARSCIAASSTLSMRRPPGRRSLPTSSIKRAFRAACLSRSSWNENAG